MSRVRTCRICDKDIPVSQFESHISECLESKKTNEIQVNPQFAHLQTESGKFKRRLSVLLPPVFQEEKTTGSISINDFILLKILRSGGFGSVYLVKKKTTGDTFALKVMTKEYLFKQNMMENVLIERDILATTNHPHLVPLFFSFSSPRKLYFAMEYLVGGDLATLMDGNIFSEVMSRHYVGEISLGLEYLHSIGVVHRDLKPENVLISATGHLKLIDFGLSALSENKNFKRDAEAPALLHPKIRKMTGTDMVPPTFDGDQVQPGQSSSRELMSSRLVGTPIYFSPEVINRDALGKECDWWALGGMMFEFLMGHLPFGNCDNPLLLANRIRSGEIQWMEGYDPVISQEARDAILSFLNPEMDKRLKSLKDIKKHPFFEPLSSWDSLHLVDMFPYFVPSSVGDSDTLHFEGEGELSDDLSVILDEELVQPRGRHSSSSGSGSAGIEDTDHFQGRFEFRNTATLMEINKEMVKTDFILEQGMKTRPGGGRSRSNTFAGFSRKSNPRNSLQIQLAGRRNDITRLEREPSMKALKMLGTSHIVKNHPLNEILSPLTHALSIESCQTFSSLRADAASKFLEETSCG